MKLFPLDHGRDSFMLYALYRVKHDLRPQQAKA